MWDCLIFIWDKQRSQLPVCQGWSGLASKIVTGAETDWTDEAALWKFRYSELIGTGRLMVMVGIYWSYQDILPSPHLTTDAFIHCKSQGLFLSQYFTEPAVDWKRSRSFCSRNLNVWFPAEQSIKINLYLAAQCSCKIMFCFSSLINESPLI